jgi:hypothetical protein
MNQRDEQALQNLAHKFRLLGKECRIEAKLLGVQAETNDLAARDVETLIADLAASNMKIKGSSE